MRVLLAEYAVATGMGGTHELEGRAMLTTLAGSFSRLGHKVTYPTSGSVIPWGSPVFLRKQDELVPILARSQAEAVLIIAPDPLIGDLTEILEKGADNLGSSAASARLAADKLSCTRTLQEAGIPVADLVETPDPPEAGCRIYVIKPRWGSGSEGVHISSFSATPQGYIATRYVEGLHLSASFVVSGENFLPLTINRQLIDMDGLRFQYDGSQVPYSTPRAMEVWDVVAQAAKVLNLRGYAGMDLVLGDRPRIVDVNSRPTTSIIGIVQVMKEELADLILRAKYGGLPNMVTIEGQYIFRKIDLESLR